MRLIIVTLFALWLPSPAASQTGDPVGNYAWSFHVRDDVVKGTMTVARADTGYRATFTSDHSIGVLAAKWVTVKDGRLDVFAVGPFGQCTFNISLIASPLAGTFKLVTDDGPTNGPLTIQRSAKSDGGTP